MHSIPIRPTLNLLEISKSKDKKNQDIRVELPNYLSQKKNNCVKVQRKSSRKAVKKMMLTISFCNDIDFFFLIRNKSYIVKLQTFQIFYFINLNKVPWRTLKFFTMSRKDFLFGQGRITHALLPLRLCVSKSWSQK